MSFQFESNFEGTGGSEADHKSDLTYLLHAQVKMHLVLVHARDGQLPKTKLLPPLSMKLPFAHVMASIISRVTGLAKSSTSRSSDDHNHLALYCRTNVHIFVVAGYVFLRQPRKYEIRSMKRLAIARPS